MKIIIGLGNIGKKYKNNRHNAGFMMLDKIQKELGFPDFAFSTKLNADISKNKDTLLVKPQTFMNRSGETVQAVLGFYKLAPEDIVVIHDDLDIEIGNYKISSDSSAAGHNGVQDIMDKLGTQNFKRIRIGVETAGGRQNRIVSGDLPSGTSVEGGDFVLQDFTEDEMEKIYPVLSLIIKDVLPKLISD